MERNEWILIGILGILKTGAAYVPIEPNYPTSRKNFIIENLIDSLLLIDRAQRGLMENRNLDLLMENTILALKRLAPPSK